MCAGQKFHVETTKTKKMENHFALRLFCRVNGYFIEIYCSILCPCVSVRRFLNDAVRLMVRMKSEANRFSLGTVIEEGVERSGA